ncbi:MAG: hypothetical protein A3H98_14610 [Bacteroidetes bacterium RIFCSPLOWO2_02_FULL_36_8]|nr:MAG: hypothetical protein A3H98_14610 [Bacteroidetes bacterium RIFCSPLOWO2_02_FULL_36_8]OFY72133.1 MAG: hypothetical protein A3G23_07165 [Bacteroidetes bacterium RIFCSPLOWO2_12_FULL_37_12]
MFTRSNFITYKTMTNKIQKSAIIIVLFALSCSFAQSQTYRKGANIISLGSGLAVYSLKLASNDSSTTAASFSFPLTYEYAFADKFGVGFVVQRNNFITGDDSAAKSTTAGGWTFGLQSTFYFLRREKVDLHTGIMLGGNTFNISGTDSNKVSRNISYSGFAFKILGLCQIYFSDKFGMYTGINITNNALSLNEFLQDGVKQEIKDDDDWKEINLSGVELMLGLVVKF